MKLRKMTAMVCMMIFTTGVLQAQKGVEFRNMTFEQAMAEAAKTNRIVFVDVTRTSPSPMQKQVDDQIFTIDSVAKFFNDNCVSIKIDMSSEEGKKFAPRLAMLMYPVYVFHDRTGDQLSFINAAQILKDTTSLMKTAKSSLATAKEKMVNTRHINFEKGNWQAALDKAKKENKLIFLDAYTEWCRPCIQMAKDVFTLDKVADVYNENFVNVSMDMEKGDGPPLIKKYKIRAYPDFLFINGKGEIVHRGSGYQEADEFIKLGEAAVKAKKKKSSKK